MKKKSNCIGRNSEGRRIFLLEAKMRDMVEYDIRVEKEDCIYFSTILGKTKKWAEND